MSAATASNPAAQTESKSSRRKKNNRTDSTNEGSQSDAVRVPEPKTDQPAGDAPASPEESPYVKELHKNVRNIKKKLTATVKVDTIISENPGKTLDDLLVSRKINADQKVQAEKKPMLQTNLAQLEDQLSHYKKFDEDTRRSLAVEKALLETSHADELEKVKEAAEVGAKAEAAKALKEKLLSLSRFLRTAAAKRQDGDETAEENRAFEGALLLVYGGDVSAVQAMEKIIEGSEDMIPTVEGESSGFTYKHVRDASAEGEYAAEEAWVDSVAQSETAPITDESPAPVQTDPTLAHASLTEITELKAAKVNGDDGHLDTPSVPAASTIGNGAANAAADANWNGNIISSITSGPDGWVDVKKIPRDPAETDTGLTATPAGNNATQSWAEDVPSGPAPGAPKDDGFQEVAHHNRGGRGRGGPQGQGRGGEGYRGRGGGYRGRGGEGRGGGRGGDGYRGRGRGGPRGGPRGSPRDGPQ